MFYIFSTISAYVVLSQSDNLSVHIQTYRWTHQYICRIWYTLNSKLKPHRKLKLPYFLLVLLYYVIHSTASKLYSNQSKEIFFVNFSIVIIYYCGKFIDILPDALAYSN